MATEKRLIDANEPSVIRGFVGGKNKYCRIGIRRKPQQERMEQQQSRFECAEDDRIYVIAAIKVLQQFCETHDCDVCPVHESNYEPGKGFACTKIPMYWRSSDVPFPTEDAVEVVHGEWEITEDDYFDLVEMKCSVCGESYGFEAYEDCIPKNYHYCPNCGAKMDLEEQG